MTKPMHGNSPETDPFARLGIDIGNIEITPLRAAELQRSEERQAELAARKAGITLTTFHLVVKDIDAETFTFDLWFEPPLEEDSNDPLSAAQSLGGGIALMINSMIKDVDHDA